jgi:hypothetical protein
MKSTTYYLTHRVWPTKDQSELPISSMTPQHLLSSYYKCIRDNWRLSFVPLLLDELASRGYHTSHPELFI